MGNCQQQPKKVNEFEIVPQTSVRAVADQYESQNKRDEIKSRADVHHVMRAKGIDESAKTQIKSRADGIDESKQRKAPSPVWKKIQMEYIVLSLIAMEGNSSLDNLRQSLSEECQSLHDAFLEKIIELKLARSEASRSKLDVEVVKEVSNSRSVKNEKCDLRDYRTKAQAEFIAGDRIVIGGDKSISGVGEDWTNAEAIVKGVRLNEQNIWEYKLYIPAQTGVDEPIKFWWPATRNNELRNGEDSSSESEATDLKKDTTQPEVKLGIQEIIYRGWKPIGYRDEDGFKHYFKENKF